jgi:glycosyltransferase involved in cell wall biosynthesis
MERPKLFVWQGGWRGGAARITRDVAEALSARGVDVTLGVFAPNPECALPQLVLAPPRWLPGIFHSLWASVVWKRRHGQTFRGVYTHTLGWWKPPATLLFVHDAVDVDRARIAIPDLPHRLVYRFWQWLYERFCLTRADIIFSATGEFTSYLRRHGVHSKRIVPSGSWFDDRFTPAPQRRMPHAPVRIVFIGDPAEPGKQFSLMREALKHNGRYELHVLGGTAKATSGQTYFHGYLSPAAVHDKLTAMDIFVMPSRSEGFSLALLEALAAGLPCVVNVSALTRELQNIRSIIPYDANRDRLSDVLRRVVEQYETLAVVDDRIHRFRRSRLLPQEADAVANAFQHVVGDVSVKSRIEAAVPRGGLKE